MTDDFLEMNDDEFAAFIAFVKAYRNRYRIEKFSKILEGRVRPDDEFPLLYDSELEPTAEEEEEWRAMERRPRPPLEALRRATDEIDAIQKKNALDWCDD